MHGNAGIALLNSISLGNSQNCAIAWVASTDTALLWCTLRMRRTLCCRRSSSMSTVLSSSAPAAVRVTPRGLRSNSGTLRLLSSARICLLTALCVRNSSVAAWVKLPQRPTASKVMRVSRGGRVRRYRLMTGLQ